MVALVPEGEDCNAYGTLTGRDRKGRDSDRKCYAVKICIEKNSRKRRVCISPEKPPRIPPPPPPPVLRRQPVTRVTQWCQTDSISISSKKCSKTLADSHCQTVSIVKEVKQCGLQTSICGTCSRECQTDLEQACHATGEPHDRRTCSKPCCHRNNEKNRGCVRRSPCETHHVFPFVGRTPSGNLKVHPRMISYEHAEFGVLVAKPGSIRTRVKKLGKCSDSEFTPRSPQLRPPPCFLRGDDDDCCGHGNAFRRNRQSAERKHEKPRKNNMPSCSPNPNTTTISQRYSKSYEDDCGSRRSNEGRKAAPECFRASCYNSEGTFTTHNVSGHADSWKYVNPQYGNNNNNEKDDGSCGGRSGSSRRHRSREARYCEQPPGEVSDGITSYSNNSRFSGRTRRMRTFSRESDEGRPPYVPPFPQHRGMSNREDYGTTATELETDEGGGTSTDYEGKPFREEPEDMVGKLHYLVKGALGEDAKVRIGRNEIPVHSVVLEIYSKIFDSTGNPRGRRRNEMDRIRVPEFVPMVSRQKRATCRRRSVKDGKRSLGKSEEEPEMQDLQEEQVVAQTAQFSGQGEDDEEEEEEEVDKYAPHFTLPPEVDPVQSFRHYPHEFTFDPPTFSEAADNQHPEDEAEPPFISPPPSPPHVTNTEMGFVEPESNFQFVPPRPSRRSARTVPDNQGEPPLAGDLEESLHPQRPKRTSQKFGERRLSAILPNLDTQQGSILLFGGVNPQLPIEPGNSGRDVFMYTLDINLWTHVGEIPHSRAHFGVARVNNYLYLIGGTDPEQKDAKGKSTPVQTNLRLNLRSGEWDSLPELEKPRSHFGCVAIDRTVYVIGGNIESRASSSCLAFNTETHSWNSITSLDTTRSNMGIAVFHGKILVAGGTVRDARKPVVETVTCYEPSLDRWTSWKSLPSPRAFCSLAVGSGRIYLIGGAGIKDLSKRRNSSLPNILWYNEDNDEWEEVAQLDSPRHGHTSIVLGDDVVIIGGVSSLTMGPLSSVEIFSTTREELRNAESLPRSSSGMGGIAL